MRALILGAGADATDGPLEYLLPMRRGSLLAWSLDQGLTVVKTMNLMARGPYQEPLGTWCPSVLY